MSSPIPSPPSTLDISSPNFSRGRAVPEAPSISHLKSLLRETLRITTNDGRIFIGTFAGTDRPLNVILINTEEYRIGPEASRNGRYVGQIVTPWKCIVKIEAAGQADPNEEDLYT